ncbi:MAG: hypothetical protein ACOCUO_00915 [archaeon]
MNVDPEVVTHRRPSLVAYDINITEIVNPKNPIQNSAPGDENATAVPESLATVLTMSELDTAIPLTIAQTTAIVPATVRLTWLN